MRWRGSAAQDEVPVAGAPGRRGTWRGAARGSRWPRRRSRHRARCPSALDCGDTGPERRLYLRELIARFGYELALNWNLGEENTQTTAQQRAMTQYIHDVDPYDHNVVLHTFPGPQPQEADLPAVARPDILDGCFAPECLERGASGDCCDGCAHPRRPACPWVVANDEQGPAGTGVPPDIGYPGFTGKDAQGNPLQSMHDIRKFTLWGNLMAGGAGVEYYFGYSLPDNDLTLENFRSRDKSWDYARIALDFFRSQRIPFWEMSNADLLAGNATNDNSDLLFREAR